MTTSQTPETGTPAAPESPQAADKRSFAQQLTTSANLRTGLLIPFLAVVTALIIGIVLIMLTGSSFGQAMDAYAALLQGSVGSVKAISETLTAATPLILAGLSVAIAFRAGLFNIGGEGQMLVGGMCAVFVGFSIIGLPIYVHLPLALLAGFIGGAIWGFIPGILKAKTGAHEVIVTIMLNYIALSFIQWIFESFFRDYSDGGLNVKTTEIASSGRMPDLVDNRLNGMFIVALFVAFLYWVIVFRSRFGFQLRASGLNPIAARTAGIPAKRMILFALLLSGAVAGLVAMPSVIGDVYAYGPSSTPTQFGFAGITVALLGRNHPFGIIVAAMLFGFLDSTSAVLQLSEIPSSIVKVIQAIIVLVVVIVNEASSRRYNRKIAERAALALKSLDVSR